MAENNQLTVQTLHMEVQLFITSAHVVEFTEVLRDICSCIHV